jgi:UDP-N-acetylglucosamine/UDP-N-acetylgalactosamine diphosphorylase
MTDPRPTSRKKIDQLISRGASVPHPESVDVGSEVSPDRISGKNVTIYPGCRIYGADTVISSGVKLGCEAPVTLNNCQLGENVELTGGYFHRSVFLDGANMGMGAHVREGCILEEQAGGAHTVGLKHTILFPFVTLGSLINFCDCFMAGGTSRAHHSEVGSSYIHFNFTPDGDKATPSLIGDVPRGVMLNQPPIFLGGQGGMVGPLRTGFGLIVAAGSILRKDYPEDHLFIAEAPRANIVRHFKPGAYPHLKRLAENNILYLANLKALEAWYANVRKSFFEASFCGALIFKGAMDNLALARKERLSRLFNMVRKASAAGRELSIRMPDIEALFQENKDAAATCREEFLSEFENCRGSARTSYIDAIYGMPAAVSARGVKWLQAIVDDYSQNVSAMAPSMNLFKK